VIVDISAGAAVTLPVDRVRTKNRCVQPLAPLDANAALGAAHRCHLAGRSSSVLLQHLFLGRGRRNLQGLR
jgi:hypothetical protein